MKKISIIIVLISFVFVNLQAQQQSDIEQIRKWYYATKNEISTSKKDKYDGSLYCDIIKRNVHKAFWEVVGDFSSNTEYWYNKDPNLMFENDNIRACLEMVIDNTQSGLFKYYSEYLYHDGQLVFAFYKVNDEEMRFYFKNNKLIKQTGEITDLPPSSQNIKANAEAYMKKYLYNCSIDN